MKIALLLLVLFPGTAGSNCQQLTSAEQSVITIDRTRAFQKITGWEATAWVGQSDFPTQFANWTDTMLDLAAYDLGINRLRVEVKSGAENPVDYFTQFINGRIARDEWKSHWHEIINDNADPNVINWNGFQFSQLDFTMDNVVVPLAQRLQQKGEKLFVNVNYVDFGCCRGSSNIRLNDSPGEYAEFVLATYLHLRDKYNIIPDAWEVVLEPDNGTGWTGLQIGAAISAAASRLETNGFNATFIAPSTTSMANAVPFFDQMIGLPGVLQHISELSYHRYSGVSDANLRAIASRAEQYQVNTAMLEHIGSDYADLHSDLKLGGNSAWSQYTLGDAWPGDTGGKYFLVDASNPARPVITMASRTKFLRQYFKFIRRGAVRIDAASSNSNLDPLAFVNTDGKYVVVVKASAAGNFSVVGLPPAVYGIKYTTSNQYDFDEPDATIAQGQSLDAFIPDRGVITVYAKQPLAPADDRAIIDHYSLDFNSSGTAVLTVLGTNIKAGATVTVGGVVPKKIRFKGEIGPGQGVFTRLKLKKRFCDGLPGDIIVTNPGAQPSEALRCDASCNN